jgi:hypothetical protein
MNRALSLVVMATLLFTIFACSGKKPLESAGIQGKSILTILKDMGQSYAKKDLDSFLSDVSDDYKNREELSKSLAAVFAKYESIRFNIQYTKLFVVAKEGGQTKTSFNWDAEWLAPGGTSQKSGGRVTFVFDPKKFKLVAIDGKNPFIPVENAGRQ